MTDEQNRLEARKAERTAPKKPFNRLRQSFREHADRLNPNPAVTVYDSRGRAKDGSDNHRWLGTGKR